jgi:hypothetical protein
MLSSTLKTKGNLRSRGLVIQPNRKIIEANDYSLTATVIFEADQANKAAFPHLLSSHPDDTRLLLHTREFTFLTTNRMQMVASYIGISMDPTPYVVQWPGNNGRDAIETHPNFEDFAGTSGDEKNGAKFDEETGEFLGFFDSSVPEFFGVRSYIVPNPVVNITYWTYRTPQVSREGTIRSSTPSGVRKPSQVKDWLILGIPYRQVGALYQVTEQLMGSGPNGWSKEIYD